MPKLLIIDDILAPEESIVINYKGDNPIQVVHKISGWLKSVFMVETKDVYERQFKISKLGDVRDFFNLWHVEKSKDKWSKIFCKVVIDGKQSWSTKKGSVRIEITAWLQTSYNYSNFIQRSFWLLYNRIFYYKMRRKYIQEGRTLVETLKDEIYKALKIPKLE